MLVNLLGITNWLEMTLIAFATYRAALMISSETGMFGIFEAIRMWVAKRFPGKPILGGDGSASGYYRQHWLTEGINCPLCVGFWLSPVCAAMWISTHIAAQLLILWLALAGVQSFLTKISNKG